MKWIKNNYELLKGNNIHEQPIKGPLMENVMICVNTYCLNFKYKINDMFNISILLLITIYLIKKSFNKCQN